MYSASESEKRRLIDLLEKSNTQVEEWKSSYQRKSQEVENYKQIEIKAKDLE